MILLHKIAFSKPVLCLYSLRKGDIPSKLPTKLHFSLGEELSLSEKVHLKFACGFEGVSDYIHKFFLSFG